ncbi:hypothetical protein D1872_322450 [compost metagenome]
MINGEMLQCIDHSHRIPAHSPAPDMKGLPRVRIAPALFSTLIPGVMQQASPWVASLLLNEQNLPCHLMEAILMPKDTCIFRKKR